jgi:hypothetical protein
MPLAINPLEKYFLYCYTNYYLYSTKQVGCKDYLAVVGGTSASFGLLFCFGSGVWSLEWTDAATSTTAEVGVGVGVTTPDSSGLASTVTGAAGCRAVEDACSFGAGDAWVFFGSIEGSVKVAGAAGGTASGVAGSENSASAECVTECVDVGGKLSFVGVEELVVVFLVLVGSLEDSVGLETLASIGLGEDSDDICFLGGTGDVGAESLLGKGEPCSVESTEIMGSISMSSESVSDAGSVVSVAAGFVVASLSFLVGVEGELDSGGLDSGGSVAVALPVAVFISAVGLFSDHWPFVPPFFAETCLIAVLSDFCPCPLFGVNPPSWFITFDSFVVQAGVCLAFGVSCITEC